jgi:RHS repeat-associated protein
MTYQVREKVTVLPGVPTLQNGSGIAHTLRTFYDERGRPTWVKSPRGFITHFQYDDVTGAVVRRIDDVDASRITGVPDGWSTPNSGGRHLISDFKVDAHGRVLRSVGPEHPVQLLETDTVTTPVRRAEFRLYRDVMQEEWSASGYEQVRDGLRSRHVVGPVHRVKRDPAGRVTDEILVTRTSDVWSPTLAEMEDRSMWCGWRRNFYDTWGRVLKTWVYHTIPSLAEGDGTATSHYDETLFGFDALGRQNRVKDATGTISRTVFDVRGLVTESWIGTDDALATDADPSGGATGLAAGNNMTKVSRREYDNAADGGNGNLTRSLGLVDGTETSPRENTFEYDFRDRLTHARATDETGNFLTETVRDVMGRVAATFRYREEPSLTSPLLIAKSAVDYDARGRAFREDAWGATPDGASAGTITSHALRTLRWFDASGNIIKSSSPGSEAREKLVYDGLDRTLARYIVLEDLEPAPGSGSDSGSSSAPDPPSSSSSSSSPSSSSSDPPPSSSSSSSSSSTSDSSDRPDPPDTPPSDSGSFAWPDPDPGSSSGDTSSDFVSGGPPPPPEEAEKTCPNCCEEADAGGQSASPGETGTTTASPPGSCNEENEESEGPVRYSSGQMNLAFRDASAVSTGVAWGHTRVVSNRSSGSTGGAHGHGVIIRQQPHLQFNKGSTGNRHVLNTGGNRSVWFDKPASGTIHRASFGGNRAVLRQVPASAEYHFYNHTGDRRVFHDDTVHPSLAGKLKAIISRKGQVTTPVYSSRGALISVTLAAAGRKTQFTYDYFGEGDGVGYAGRLATVTVEAGPEAAPEERRRVRYDYYNGTGSHGVAGDLRMVFHEEWDGSQWYAVRCEYYRYYTTAWANVDGQRGFQHSMKYAVGAAGCVALGNPDHYDSLTNAQVLAASDYYFEYDNEQRVSLEKLEGGRRTYEFTYEPTELSPAPGFTGFYNGSTTVLNTNLWFTRTTETIRDATGSVVRKNIVYTNRMGKVIASTMQKTAADGTPTGEEWHRFNLFDAEGRHLRRFTHSAIESITPPAALDLQPTISRKPTAGLVVELTYYPTSATEEGEVPGLIETEGHRQGDTGPLHITRRVRYGTREVDDVSIHPVIEEIQYAVTGGVLLTGALVTRSQYKYYGDDPVTVGDTGPDPIEDIEFTTVNDVSEDIVFEQQKTTFDPGGNVIFSRSYRRFHDATLKGELHGPDGTSPRGRRSYAAFYPDGAGRRRFTADFGTNGGHQLSRPAVCPSSATHSATALKHIKVTRTRYNLRGEAFQFTDPLGTITEWTNDLAGRRTQLIENVSALTGPDRNRITNFKYLPGGLLDEMTIPNPDTDTQITKWLYGTEKSATDSSIATRHLLSAKKYASDTTSWLKWRYNALAEVTHQTDANGTIRQFIRDRLGRLTDDTVLTRGTSGGALIDDFVMRLSRSYNKQGRLHLATSHSSTGTVRNQVGFSYSAFGQTIADRQAHGDEVDEATTPAVLYGYEPGNKNHLRLNSLKYPDEIKEMVPGYGDVDSVNDRLSRPQHLQFTADADPAVQYLYAGLSWIVEAAYPEADTKMTHFDATATVFEDGGDQYVGIDRFGRLEHVRWHRIGDPASWVEKLIFGYDKADNRLWRVNELKTDTEDELYGYDGLYQVQSRKRGHLNSSRDDIASPARIEDFTYDPIGNWNNYKLTTDTGVGNLDQDRTHNKSNQIKTIDESDDLVAHDPAGNMTTVTPARHATDENAADWTKGYLCTWDAWNRLVKTAKQESPSTVVAQYQYDALFRRTLHTADGTTHHEYWDAAWRLMEERSGSATTPDYQYLYGLRHRNDLILRDAPAASESSESSSSSSSTSADTTRLYVTYDWINPSAILARHGEILERQSFSAFGQRRLLTGTWGERATSELADWNFSFHGQFTDLETGWANYGFRYWSPTLGRWLSRDPAAGRGGSNHYAYALNRPCSLTDLYGLVPDHYVIDGRTGFNPSKVILPGKTASQPSHSGNYTIEPEIECACCLVIYVHGYNETHAKAVQWGKERILDGHRKSGGKCSVATFSWKSDFGKTQFSQSKQAADLTAPVFAKAVKDIQNKCPNMKIHIITHSLGARVALKAIQDQGLTGINDLALVAPAVDNESLQPGEEFKDVSSRVNRVQITYNSEDDAMGYYTLDQLNVGLGDGGYDDWSKVQSNVYLKNMEDVWASHDDDGGHGAILHGDYYMHFWNWAPAGRGFAR